MIFQPGDRVEVDISAGLLPGVETEPQWETGTIEDVQPSGMLVVRLDGSIAGRPALKEARMDHLRPASDTAAAERA